VRADRPSLTASLVAAIRALYTELPPPYNLAPDPFAAELLPLWLSLPARAAGLVPWAAPAVHRLAGAVALGLTYNVALRTRAIDDALREALAGGTTQLVVLGAGLDSRAYRIDELAGGRAYEVDYPSTHRYKAERIARLETPRDRRVARVAIDFERDRLGDVLTGAGFDPRAPSFWIWEGVTIYLTPETIAATLRAVGELSAPGSRLAVTYTQPGARRGHAWIEALTPILGAAVSEPVRGMIETGSLHALLDAAGFSPVSDENAADWAARYWPGETHAREWERLAVAERR
jgi:methyltransferase (TIGR00027 family)